MVSDYRRKVEESQSGFEKLIGSIPGYQGYKERELRREADKLLRDHLARGFDEQRRRLVGVLAQLTNAGRLAETVALERANLRLQLLIDRLRIAAYGYAGLFDAFKVEQAELDALYEFDSALATGVDRVAELVGSITGLAGKGDNTAAEAGTLLDVLQDLNDTFGRRMEAITG
jgi:hypothetical protein